MSIPEEIYSCRRCDFKVSSSVTWGEFIYLIGFTGFTTATRGIKLPSGIGWCNNCGTISSIEKILKFEDILKLKDSILAKENKIKTLELDNKKTFMKKVFRLREKSAAEYYEFKNKLRHDKINLSHYEEVYSITKDKQLKGRCLSCRSVDNFIFGDYVVPKSYWQNPGEEIEIGSEHPFCGGQLIVRSTGRRINMVFEKKAFLIE